MMLGTKESVIRVAQRSSKEERLAARVTAETKALFSRAASLQGRSVSDFVVQSSLEAAQRVIREHEYLDVSQRDRLAFLEAVLHPLPPSERLTQAARRHQSMLGE